MKEIVIRLGAREAAVFLSAALLFGGGFATVSAFNGGATTQGLPMVLPYQGTLAKDGMPVDGTQPNVVFKLHTSESGAARLWSSDSRTLDVKDGKFAVTLGDANDATSLEPHFFENAALYVSVTIDGAEMSPRQRVAPTPQAILAAKAVTADQAIVADRATIADRATTADQADVAVSAQSVSSSGSLRTELDTLSPKLPILADSSVSVTFGDCGVIPGATCPSTVQAYIMPTTVAAEPFNVSAKSRWLVKVRYSNVESWGSSSSEQYIAAVVDGAEVVRIQRYTVLGLDSSDEAVGVVDLAPGMHTLELKVQTPTGGPTMYAPFQAYAWQIGVTN